MSDKKLLVETIRLLLYVAWSDDDIAPEEYDYLLRKARNAGMSEDEIRSLDRALRDRSELRRPDIGFLKPHRDEVLREARTLVHVDNRVLPQEIAVLNKITSLLSD